MKARFLIPILLLFAGNAIAQKDTAHVGLYINSLYDFKIEDKSFMTDFWMWMTYKNDSLHFENVVEVPNSKSADFSHYNYEKKGNINWVTQKCKAQVIHEWSINRFPFDRQILRIKIEDSEYDTSQLVYAADNINSHIDSSLNSKEWSIGGFTIKNDYHTYNTTYGNPTLSGNSTYPSIVAEIEIRRKNSWRLLIEMLTGAYVAFLISCIVFFISSESQDSRFGLCVGGLFAAIGNKYIVENVVSSTTTSTLMDDVHNITFVFILIIIGVITLSLHYFQSGDENKKRFSLKIDKWAFWILLSAYTLLNVWLITCCLYQ
jgi:hypothetical protein